jgi:hypothetical protein
MCSMSGMQEALAGGDTEIDIEIDPELLPVMEPQFLDQRLLTLSQKWNGCPPSLLRHF